MMKIPIMSYAINLTFWLLVWLVPGEKFYGLGTGFQFQTIPVPLYVLNPMGLLWFPTTSVFVHLLRDGFITINEAEFFSSLYRSFPA